MQKSKGTFILLTLAAAFLLSGCADKAQRPRVLWPPPPERPRLEWIGNFQTTADFPKGGAEALWSKVAGEEMGIVFKSPFDVVSDGAGVVYVSDIHWQNVRTLDFATGKVGWLSDDPVFSRTAGLAIDGAGRIYVVDGGSGEVKVFAGANRPLFAFGKGRLNNPAFIALNERMGRIYVSDGKAHKIVVFDTEGNFLFDFGEWGGVEGAFHSPQGLAVDDQDRLFVADMFNARIQVFDSGGNYLYQFGERGDQAGMLENPKDIAFDAEGHLYLVDSRKGMVSIFSKDGKLLLYLGGAGRTNHPLGFSTPTGLFLDPDGRIYVADMLNRRISIWQYLNAPYLRAHPVTEEQTRAIEEEVRKSLPGDGGGPVK